MDNLSQPAGNPEGQQDNYNPQLYLAALERMNSQTDRRILVIRIVVIVALLAALPWAIGIYFNLGNREIFYFWFIAVFILIDVIPLFWSGSSFNWQLSKLTDQLRYSGLADRLALGELENNDPIFENTAWYLRWLLPRNPGRNPEVTLKRVTASLHWYAAAPRRHVRPTWIIPLAFLPMLLMFAPVLWMNNRFGGSGFSSGFDFFAVIPILIIISIPIMFEVMHRTYLWFLTNYLKESWSKETGSGSRNVAVETAVESSLDSAEVERRFKILQTVNQVQQDLEQGLMQLAMPVMMLWMFALMPIAMTGMVGSRNFPFMMLIVLVPAVFLLGTTKLATAGFKSFRERTRTQLESSGIAIEIASGELNYDGPIQSTPLLLRWTHSWPRMPKGFADALRMRIWRVSLNLDWYLSRREYLLRPAWICNMLLGVATLLSFFLLIFAPIRSTAAISSAAPPPSVMDLLTSSHAVWLVLLVIGLGIPGLLYAVQARIWTDELIKHLRERLAG